VKVITITNIQNPIKLFFIPAYVKYLTGEFDPGSGRTLAACLTHASRAGVSSALNILKKKGAVEASCRNYINIRN